MKLKRVSSNCHVAAWGFISPCLNMENIGVSTEKHTRDSITTINCQPVNTGDYRLIIGRAAAYIALRTITANRF
jgi:hypothetical protein